MTRRGPGAKLIEFEGIGHLPALITEGKVQPIRNFLETA